MSVDKEINRLKYVTFVNALAPGRNRKRRGPERTTVCHMYWAKSYDANICVS